MLVINMLFPLDSRANGATIFHVVATLSVHHRQYKHFFYIFCKALCAVSLCGWQFSLVFAMVSVHVDVTICACFRKYSRVRRLVCTLQVFIL